MAPTPQTYVKRNRFWPPRDREDNPIPHKIETIGFLRAVPHLLSFFDKVVPEEFWTEESDVAGTRIVIACPCGEEPVLEYRLRSYSIAECDCERFFMHDGTQVRVGKSDDSAS